VGIGVSPRTRRRLPDDLAVTLVDRHGRILGRIRGVRSETAQARRVCCVTYAATGAYRLVGSSPARAKMERCPGSAAVYRVDEGGARDGTPYRLRGVDN
jgi:hypothetical protein